MKGILGQKVGMTRVYDEAGMITPVTVILAEPNAVVQIKTRERDGYEALQVGVATQKESRLSRPLLGQFKKAGVAAHRFVRELPVPSEGEPVKVGDAILVTRFQPGEYVDVIGISKGKGFQGVVRRHNFAGQGAAHGSKTHRRNGAIGERSTPGRIYKNHGMPGQMGKTRITVQNLRVVQVRESDNALLVRGAIPGPRGSYVLVRLAIKGQPKARTPQAASKSNKPIVKASKK